MTLVTFLTAKISVFQNLWTSCALPTYQRDSFYLCGDVSFYCQSKCDLFLTQSAVFREVLLLAGPLKRTELLFLHHWRVFWMLIVKYWSRLHLTAEVFISLLNHFPCNRWSLLLALSLCLPNLLPIIIYPYSLRRLVFPTGPVCLFLTFYSPSSSSYRHVAFVGFAVCLRSRVHQERPPRCGVDLLSALVFVGVADRRKAGPAQEARTVFQCLWVIYPHKRCQQHGHVAWLQGILYA